MASNHKKDQHLTQQSLETSTQQSTTNTTKLQDSDKHDNSVENPSTKEEAKIWKGGWGIGWSPIGGWRRGFKGKPWDKYTYRAHYSEETETRRN